MPKTVEITAFILSAFLKQKIRPPNSPILLGVKIETVIPKKIAFSDIQTETVSSLFIKYFHLIDSRNQLRNISNKTPTRGNGLFDFKISPNHRESSLKV